MWAAARQSEFPPLPRPIVSHITDVHVQPPTVFVQPQWAYQEIVRDLDASGALSEAELNARGDEGWELTGILQDGRTVRYYFKRQTR